MMKLLLRGKPSNRREAFAGLAFFLICVAAVQTVDLLFTPSQFYDSLGKPDYAPPAWAFSPVWTLLWALTAAAAWVAWRDSGLSGAKDAFTLWFLHLAGNVLWTYLFFQQRALEWAAVEICFLTIVVLGAVVAFWRVRPLSGLLLLPLLAWLFFASNVSLRIAELN